MHMLSTMRSSNSMSGFFSATCRATARKRPSVCFMMLALCTAVTLRRLYFGAESEGEWAARAEPGVAMGVVERPLYFRIGFLARGESAPLQCAASAVVCSDY